MNHHAVTRTHGIPGNFDGMADVGDQLFVLVVSEPASNLIDLAVGGKKSQRVSLLGAAGGAILGIGQHLVIFANVVRLVLEVATLVDNLPLDRLGLRKYRS